MSSPEPIVGDSPWGRDNYGDPVAEHERPHALTVGDEKELSSEALPLYPEEEENPERSRLFWELDVMMRRGREDQNFGRGRGSDQAWQPYGLSVRPRDLIVTDRRPPRTASDASSLIRGLEDALGVPIEDMRAAYPTRAGKLPAATRELRRRITEYIDARVLPGQSARAWALALGAHEETLKRDLRKWGQAGSVKCS